MPSIRAGRVEDEESEQELQGAMPNILEATTLITCSQNLDSKPYHAVKGWIIWTRSFKQKHLSKDTSEPKSLLSLEYFCNLHLIYSDDIIF